MTGPKICWVSNSSLTSNNDLHNYLFLPTQTLKVSVFPQLLLLNYIILIQCFHCNFQLSTTHDRWQNTEVIEKKTVPTLYVDTVNEASAVCIVTILGTTSHWSVVIVFSNFKLQAAWFKVSILLGVPLMLLLSTHPGCGIWVSLILVQLFQ